MVFSTLRLGSRGNRVKLLQKYLGIKADGIFGKATHNSVLKFQDKSNLLKDGIVGSLTLKKLISQNFDSSLINLVKPIISGKVSINPFDDTKLLAYKISSLFKNNKRIETNLVLGLDYIKPHIEVLGLDTLQRISHFFGHVRQEVGFNYHNEEGFNYSPQGLIKTFKFYRNNTSKAYLHGRHGGIKASQRDIANHVYSYRYGNGDVKSNDGWNYRGLGSLQVTFKTNNKRLDDLAEKLGLNLGTSYLGNPEIKLSPEHSLMSAGLYWKLRNLGDISNIVNKQSSYGITKFINRYTNSYDERWKHTKKLSKILGCYK